MKVAAWAITPNSASKEERSRLCFACSALNIDLAVQLIDSGVMINADASFGHGPLMALIRTTPPRIAAQEAMIDFLVAEGADVNYMGKDGVTPLCAAVETGHTELVVRLLAHGADINDCRTAMPLWKWHSGNDLSALHVAVGKGKSECLQILIERGANYKQSFRLSNIFDVTPLHVAVNDLACVTLLAGLGADPMSKDSKGRTPFHWAVEAVNVDVVVWFLKGGFPVDHPGEEGVSALGMVCAALEQGVKSGKFPSLTKELLQAGANLDIVYPQDLSIRQRWLLMDDWRVTYEPIFKRHACN
ncbi:ankyrin repeat domain-containing protein 52 [Colletotrichum truncatum]|uniref:Ankyrin repeat domain-containing protein 52 n=1 Tax=Colletotrichum truncatum TaxID=5467 RepID=A0ACC3Z1R9_COLTU